MNLADLVPGPRLQGLKELVKLGLVESMDAIQRIAAESLQEMEAVTDRLKVSSMAGRDGMQAGSPTNVGWVQGEARARDGDGEGEEDGEGDGEDEDGEGDGEDEDGEGEAAAEIEADLGEQEASQGRGGATGPSAAADEEEGPKIEVLEDLPRDESHV
jgi:hypothetical protein